MQMPKWSFRLGLQTRISLLVILGLVLIFAFMAWEGRQIADANTQMVLQERLNLARVIAQHLDRDLDRTLNRLAQVAAFPTINLEDGDLEPEKAELRALYRPDYFSYVFLLDKDGLVLWTEPYLPDVVNREHMECPHVQETLRTGKPAIACVAHALTPLSPVIAPVVPIRNRQGAIVGALGAAIDPSSPPFVSIFEGMAPGNTGYIQLVDENGIVLAHTRRQHLFQKSEHADLFISLLKDNKPAIATHTVTEENKGTSREVIAFAPLTVAPWGVAEEQDEAEFLALSLEALRRMELFAVIAVAATLLIVWVTTRSVLQPVRKLMTASARIAAGDLATPVPPLGKDEIGELGRRFEEMRLRLARWGDELETKVKERTEALRISHRFLEIANRHTEMSPMLKECVAEVQKFTGCSAVGIRMLGEEGNIPYEAYKGFSRRFYDSESPLSIKSDQCMCINVIKGDIDPQRSFYTKGGSFYMNGTTRFLAKVSEEEKGRTRNVCNAFGYESVALVPIRLGERILGLIHVADQREDMVPLETIETLESVAMQLGEAIQRLRVEEETKRRTRELSTLYTIDRAAAQSLDLDEILNDSLDKVLEVLEVEAGGFFLLEPDGETMTLRVHRGISDEFAQNVQRIKLGEGVSGRAAAEQKPVVLDVADYPTERLAPYIVQEGIQTLASTPLLSAGELVGALNLATRRPRAFPPEEMDLLTAIGRQLGGAVANAQLHQETRQRAERLSILNRIARALASTLNLDELLEIVHREIMTVVEADTFFIALYDGEANELDFRIQVDKGISEPPMRRPMAPGLTASVVSKKQPLLIRNFEQEKDRLPPVKLWGTMEAPASWLGLPMLRGEEVIGVISVQAYRPNAYGEADQQLLSTIADAVAMAVENARLYETEQRRAARLTAIQQLGTELAVLREESAVLNTLVRRTAALAESPACTVMLVDETTPPGEAVLAAQTGLPEGTPLGLRVPLKLPLIRRSLESGEPIILPNIDRDRSATKLRTLLVRTDVQAFFAYPMVREGRVLGFITLSSLAPRTPSAGEITAYKLLAERAAAALENTRLDQSLRASEQEYRTLVENATELIWALDTEGHFTFINQLAEEISGHKVEDLIGKSFAPLIAPPEDLPRIQQIFLETLAGKPQSYEVGVCRADGSIFRLSVNTTPLYRDGEVIGTISFGRDVTAEKEAEAALRSRMAELSALFEVSSVLRGAKGVDEMLPILLDETLAVINTEAGSIYLYDVERDEIRKMVARGWYERIPAAPMKPNPVPAQVLASGQLYLTREFAADPLPENIRSYLPAGWGGAIIPLRAAQETVGLLFVAVQLPRELSVDEIHLLTTLAEIAGNAIRRASLNEQTQRQVQRLASLRSIDMAISSVLNLRLTLDILLDHILTQMGVDAADILLYNPNTQMLEYGAGRGFRSKAQTQLRLRLGESQAGRAALERRMVAIPDIQASEAVFSQPHLLVDESFSAYYAVPLITKGQVKGVLEIFHRSTLNPDAEWLNFLETLAGQAAIALDNAALFEGLQRSNLDLALAYDTTLEGWAKALELRDKETEGHTQRVTELTLQLARAMGVSDAEMAHLRRGALLHDIGKMGVPDDILRKPGPLTDEEWVIMRQHPQFAFEMLSPISYLRQALDIPSGHHEKWDGSGYPRGLKGEQIPLAARIFAVVDVWDALLSDRPYRKAWSQDRTTKYIREQAGKHFDPKVVEAFLINR